MAKQARSLDLRESLKRKKDTSRILRVQSSSTQVVKSQVITTSGWSGPRVGACVRATSGAEIAAMRRRSSRRSLHLRRSMPESRPLWDGGAVMTEIDQPTAEQTAVEEPVRWGGASELTIEEAREELQRLERRLLNLEPASGGTTHQWKMNRLTSKLKRVQAAAAPPPWYSCPKIEAHSGTVPKDSDRLAGGRRARKLRARRLAAERNELASLSLRRVDMAALQSEWLAGLDVAAMQRISPKDSAIGAWIAQQRADQASESSGTPSRSGTPSSPATVVQTVPLVGRARALHDWNIAAGADASDLHFSASEEFDVVSEEPGQGWLTGSIHDSATGETKVGIFPGNYVDIVTPLPETTPTPQQPSKTEHSRFGRKHRQDKLARPKTHPRSPNAHGRGLGGSSVDVTGHISMRELLGPVRQDEPGWRAACMCVSLRRPDGGWHEKGWKEVAAVEGTVQRTAAAAGVVPPKDGAFRVHTLGPNAGLGAVFTIADDPIDYSDGEDPRTEAVCGIVAVHPRSFAAIAGVVPEQVVVAINGKLCADAANGDLVMSRRAAVIAMLDEAVHSGDEHVLLHLASPERWRNVVRPLLRKEFDGVKKQRHEEPLFYESSGCGGGVRVHPLYWSLGPEDMCVTVEYTALNQSGQPVDGHCTGAELQSTTDFYVAAVQLREAMRASFGPDTPGGSPKLPVSLIPAVGISTGLRSRIGIFEIQLAKRWDAGLEIYAISTQSRACGAVGGHLMVATATDNGGEVATHAVPASGSAAVDSAISQAKSPQLHERLPFSLPADTESDIVTKIGETLGFWVAGDDVNYDTFGALEIGQHSYSPMHPWSELSVVSVCETARG